MMGPITWQTISIKLSDLIEWEDNPVTLSREEADQIQRSLKKYGLVIPLVANVPLKNGRARLIDGHQRKHVIEFAKMIDPESVVEVRIPSRRLTSAECEELSIRLRRNTGTWDFDKLANHFNVEDLLQYGFTERELHLNLKGPLDLGSDKKPGDQVTESEKILICPKCGFKFKEV